MIIDRWYIVHIGIGVPDLEAAMDEYSRGFGIEWSGVHDVSVAALDVEPKQFSTDGLRVAFSRTGIRAVTGGLPHALLELVYAEPSSPAYEFYGCPSGQHYLHHICYAVDDPDVESQHLVKQGFQREVLIKDQQGRSRFIYHRLMTSMWRIELVPVESKLNPAEWTLQ
jgi:hypothetical protein